MKNKILAAVAISGMMVSGAAFADTATGTLDVRATVSGACTVTATPMLFGALPVVVAVTGAVTEATSTVTVNCTLKPKNAPSVAVGAGSNEDSGARRLVNGASSVVYTLSSSTAPGDQVALNGAVTTAVLSGAQSVTLYGNIAAGQAVAQGAYTDDVTLTVTYDLTS
jgi:spore coat protein U-like protein